MSHHTYQLAKIHRTKGIITISRNAKVAMEFEKQSLDMVEQSSTPPTTDELLRKKSKPRMSAKPDGATKLVLLSSSAPNKDSQNQC